MLVVTEDDFLFSTFSGWFGGRAETKRVDGPLDLVRQVDQARDARCLVVLDGRNPTIRPSALAVLLEDLPAVEVIVCRAAAATMEMLLATSPAAARWAIYREPASLDHVAAECLRRVS